jgi:leucyl aminopeptidase
VPTVLVPSTDPASANALPVHFVEPNSWRGAASAASPLALAFAEAQGFEAGAGQVQLLPGTDGTLAAALFGLGSGTPDPLLAGKLPGGLPAGAYRLVGADDEAQACLAFLLGGYRFTRYRKGKDKALTLVAPAGIDVAEINRIAGAVRLGRDLINTPSNDCGPADLEAAARALAVRMQASLRVIEGEALLAENFPMIHAVGRASTRAPRLIDLGWGDPTHPKVTLVGKGVCFDTGGLNLKPDAGMLLMKKDMGGAATVLAAAQMIMEAGLRVRLRVLVPAVENSVSGNAFRPGDVLPSRKGLTVEIGNTDAEGRLILADALALADEDEPDLLVDFATLTGAARVALGPDLPPFYTDDDALAASIAAAGIAVADPVWRMPLWQPYAGMLDSKIADINHVSGGAFAGSVTAALFLHRFVEKARSWVHFDVFGWVPAEKPGRPFGGEPQGARLLFRLLDERYGRAG